MAITRLKRKDRKNKARANNRVERIKQLLSVPVIKNVDPEELKAQFSKSAKEEPKAKKASAKKETEANAEVAETSAEAETTSSEDKGE